MVKTEALHNGRTAMKFREERGAVMVVVDRLGAQHVLGECLYCAFLMRQKHSLDNYTTDRLAKCELASR